MFDICCTPVSLTIRRMADLIDSVTAANHQLLGALADVTPFHSRAVPAISVCDYLERVAKFVCLQNDVLLAILVYLDRIARAQRQRPALAVSPFNIHRLLITAIVVAHKFHSDVFFNNARYSKVGGIPLVEMNQLELELLFLVRFDLNIDADEIQRVGDWLMTGPHARVAADTQHQSQQHQKPLTAISVLDPYYQDVARNQAALCQHLQFPTPAMGPTTASPAVAVPPLELSTHAPPHQNQNQNQNQYQYQHQNQHQHQHPQPVSTQYYVQTHAHLPSATPSSMASPASAATNAHAHVHAPLCQGCETCRGPVPSWQLATMQSPVSPATATATATATAAGSLNGVTKKRRMHGIGIGIGMLNSASNSKPTAELPASTAAVAGPDKLLT
ncbi:cyclin-like protein interacting with PHO85 [Coemansia sp. Benny D115]|nr:cyclin-like protein interacting with PHO85 [Coemansia sp. Benny D115]